MELKKSKKAKLYRMIACLIAAAIVGAVLGGALGMLATKTAKQREPEKKELKIASFPGAGVGTTIKGYVGAAQESSLELLSTTALGASYGNINEYYDAKGGSLGKNIIYVGENNTNVYDKIPGNERIEKGDPMAIIVGRMSPFSVATLLKVCGNWYQIVSKDITGFVNSKDFVLAKEAEALNDSTYQHVATTNTDDVYIRETEDETSTIICVLPSEVSVPVLEYGDSYSKVFLTGLGEGWVSNDEVFFFSVRKMVRSVEADSFLTNAVSNGMGIAEEVEAELQKEAEGLARSYALAHIEPAPPDSEDVASLRQAVANYAQEFVGILPYVWGGADLTSGADCSGFTSAVYAAYGIEIPRSSDTQAFAGTTVSMDDLRPGDIVGYPGHVAMYIGGETVVHAPTEGRCVEYGSLYMMEIINVTRYIN